MEGVEAARLTHLGLEPVWELRPQAVKFKAHFGVHPNSHVVVHDLGLYLHGRQASSREYTRQCLNGCALLQVPSQDARL